MTSPRPPARDLRQFLERLRSAGDLVEVRARVDPDQELAEIHRRVIAADGPALLFSDVAGSPFPVVTNLFGTPRRVQTAFGEEPLRFIRDAVRLAHELLPPTTGRLWRERDFLLRGLRVGFARRGGGPVLEVCERPPRLDTLPMLTCWPEDGGPFLTLPLVLTHGPHDGRPNLGMYRLQRFDAATMGFHFQIGKGAGFHYAEAEAEGRPLPVSVFLGGPPALVLAAIAPLPEGVPELLLASLALGRRLPLTRHVASPHPLIADAEFALVGQVPPCERRPEGPFGDHYGYYSLRHDYPVFHCRAMLRRRDAIYPATVVGKPRQEDYYIGEYLQRLLSPLFPLVMPAVRDLWSYGETGFHALAAAVVRERYHREAMGAAFRILGEGQLALTKFLIVIAEPRDLSDFRGVLEYVLARFRPETDLYVFANLSMDTLDYTGPEVNKGSKGVMLGVGEPWRDPPREWTRDPPAGARDPHVFCAGCVAFGGPPFAQAPDLADQLARDPALADWPLVILCDDPRRCTATTINFLWTVFMRFEPAADIHTAGRRIQRNHIVYSGPVVIDARMKPHYPRELFAAPEIADRVTRRWREYFPEGSVEMGSSELAHLT